MSAVGGLLRSACCQSPTSHTTSPGPINMLPLPLLLVVFLVVVLLLLSTLLLHQASWRQRQTGPHAREHGWLLVLLMLSLLSAVRWPLSASCVCCFFCGSAQSAARHPQAPVECTASLTPKTAFRPGGYSRDNMRQREGVTPTFRACCNWKAAPNTHTICAAVRFPGVKRRVPGSAAVTVHTAV